MEKRKLTSTVTHTTHYRSFEQSPLLVRLDDTDEENCQNYPKDGTNEDKKNSTSSTPTPEQVTPFFILRAYLKFVFVLWMGSISKIKWNKIGVRFGDEINS